jgi:DNA-binding response OmpR family regulator
MVNNFKRVLLAEDDSDQAAIFQMRFISAGFAIEIATNGQEALTLLERNTDLPHIIVSDLMMPAMDGYELIAILRNSPLYCTIPIIVLTAVTDVDNEQRLCDFGVDGYCEKTAGWKVLLSKVEGILSQYQEYSKE